MLLAPTYTLLYAIVNEYVTWFIKTTYLLVRKDKYIMAPALNSQVATPQSKIIIRATHYTTPFYHVIILLIMP